MAFSFTPGQEQTTPAGQEPQPQAPLMRNGIPALVVPTIAVGETVVVEQKISPFAFRNRNKSKFGVYFQSVVFLVFGVLLITVIGLFAYISVLKSSIATKSEVLASSQGHFPELPLDDMQKLSDRLKIVNRVIKEHASVRTAFQILENSVENPVVYTKFDLSKNKAKKGYSLGLAAETDSYHAAYQQTEILNSKTYSNYVSPLEVSNISLDKKGVVSFKISTSVSLEGVLPETVTFDSSTTDTTSQLTPDPISTTTPQ
jgi:hypothetical protein